MDAADYLDLLDWRRAVAELYSEVRRLRAADPAAAHAQWRAGRDALYGGHPSSAFPESGRERFAGLRYYDYDPALAFTAPIRSLPEERFDVGTSGGSVIPFVRFGAIDLPVGTLEVFWLDAYSGGVFIPFRDGTSGDTTYGGGRYLLDTAKSADLGRSAGDLILDFNFSYHPSCHYDPLWICPLAPPSNRLTARVEAGERSYPGASAAPVSWCGPA